jgi:hypothetical protein
MLRLIFGFWLIFVANLLLNSCSYFSNSPANQQRSFCKQIKSQLLFNGATANTRQANIQMTQDPRLKEDYDKQNCDQF